VRDAPEEIAEDIALLKHALGKRTQVEDALKALDEVVGPNASVTDIAKAIGPKK
jgi:hypothetical protein